MVGLKEAREELQSIQLCLRDVERERDSLKAQLFSTIPSVRFLAYFYPLLFTPKIRNNVHNRHRNSGGSFSSVLLYPFCNLSWASIFGASAMRCARATHTCAPLRPEWAVFTSTHDGKASVYAPCARRELRIILNFDSRRWTLTASPQCAFADSTSTQAASIVKRGFPRPVAGWVEATLEEGHAPRLRRPWYLGARTRDAPIPPPTPFCYNSVKSMRIRGR